MKQMHIYLSEHENDKIKELSYHFKVKFFVDCLKVYEKYLPPNSLENEALQKVIKAFEACFTHRTFKAFQNALNVCTQATDWVDFDSKTSYAIHVEHTKILDDIIYSDKRMKYDCALLFEQY